MAVGYLPGDLLYAEDLNAWLPYSLSKAVTEQRSSTSITADAELALTLPVGTYHVMMRISIASDSNVAGGGVQTRWSLTSGTTLMGFRHTSGPAPNTTSPSSQSARRSVNGVGTALAYGAGDGFTNLEEWARVSVPSGGGTVALLWGRATGGAWAQVGVGSDMTAIRVA
ncbi:hypothetical protein [Streptomyces sp. NPDC049881]|uniref:hypothetical protein n=1 Tax=Streptomyces sp. NPDC049881 TaxID=3155778 RepID=UPI003445E26B